MWLRVIFSLLCVICFSNLAHAKDERWYNFAEDSDLRYYIDQQSMVTRDSDIHIFWVKSVAKSKDYYKQEYNLNNLSYILISYEIDCSDATYRVRQTLMMDRNRRELNKSAPAGAETEFEPIPPESALELAQDMVCAKAAGDEGEAAAEEEAAPTVAPARPQQPKSGVEEPADGDNEPGIQ